MSSITIPCVVFLSCLCPQFFQTSAPLSSCCCAFCICAQTVLVFYLSVSARYSPLAVFDHINRCSLLSVSILFLVFSCNIFSQKPLFFKHCSLANPILIHHHPHTSLPISTPSIIHHSRLTICLPDSLDLDPCL